MNCKRCRRMLYIDHNEGTVRWWVCMNPRCSEYRKAFNKDGEEQEAMMTRKDDE